MSEISARQRITRLCARLGTIYRSLHEASQAFLSEAPSVEKIVSLLDQRDFTLEEARDIEREALEIFSLIGSPPTNADFGQVIRFLENGEEADRAAVEDLRQALKNLVSSDLAIDEWMKNQKGSVVEELKKVRRGSSMLKGYASSDPVGSCFIDKIK